MLPKKEGEFSYRQNRQKKEAIFSLPSAHFNLVIPSTIAMIPSEKAEALKSQFSPPCQMLTSPISLMLYTQLKCLPPCQFLKMNLQVLSKRCTLYSSRQH
jgi:hypothetical protein